MKKDPISLVVSAREAKEKPNAIRRAGSVPGVIYGSIDNTAIKCSAKDVHNVFVKAGENTIVEVDTGKKKVPCLIHAISFHPVSGKVEHVDLYAVDMTKKVTTHVPVILKGESLAVKAQGGVLVTVHSQLEVSCLPADLPSSFTIDISKLENLRDSVTVGSLQIPKGVTMKNGPETVIVMVQEPRKEEVITPVVTAVAEGEAAAPGAPGAAAPSAPGAAPAATAGAPAAKGDDKAAKAAAKK